jgi:hypothetical protein
MASRAYKPTVAATGSTELEPDPLTRSGLGLAPTPPPRIMPGNVRAPLQGARRHRDSASADRQAAPQRPMLTAH